MPRQVHVYGKPGCPLCDEALERIAALPPELELQVTRYNIYEHDRWFEAYRYRVPVVVIDGVERLELRFSTEQLLAALQLPAALTFAPEKP